MFRRVHQLWVHLVQIRYTDPRFSDCPYWGPRSRSMNGTPCIMCVDADTHAEIGVLCSLQFVHEMDMTESVLRFEAARTERRGSPLPPITLPPWGMLTFLFMLKDIVRYSIDVVRLRETRDDHDGSSIWSLLDGVPPWMAHSLAWHVDNGVPSSVLSWYTNVAKHGLPFGQTRAQDSLFKYANVHDLIRSAKFYEVENKMDNDNLLLSGRIKRAKITE